MAKKFLRLKDVLSITGLAKTTIYKKINEGDFPRPVKLGERCSAWLDSEISQWQDDRIAERDSVSA